MNYMNKIINLLGVALMPVIALAGGPEQILPPAVSTEETLRNFLRLLELNVGLPHIHQPREEEVDSSLRNHPREALESWLNERSPKIIRKAQTPLVPRKARKK